MHVSSVWYGYYNTSALLGGFRATIQPPAPVNHPTVGCRLSDPQATGADRLHRNCGGAVAEYGYNLHCYIT